ncbi:aminotransferase class I/II-fold pyridoxal phosphate-dependent enzyme, partial [bacterium]|nr:aminotransferase class I/II-fold pyridoxal phosphate-dependent enzyme [bacterium]
GVVEVCRADGIDMITGTLGKAFGVDGGFVVTDKLLVEYLRETSPFYIYSNPIAAGAASASLKALEILDSNEGLRLLTALRENSEYFRKGIEKIGLKTIEGSHPIVPVVIGDPLKAKKMAIELYGKGILVIALTFPVVPKGQDTIRVQISASHTRKDLDYALESFKEVS